MKLQSSILICSLICCSFAAVAQAPLSRNPATKAPATVTEPGYASTSASSKTSLHAPYPKKIHPKIHPIVPHTTSPPVTYPQAPAPVREP